MTTQRLHTLEVVKQTDTRITVAIHTPRGNEIARISLSNKGNWAQRAYEFLTEYVGLMPGTEC